MFRTSGKVNIFNRCKLLLGVYCLRTSRLTVSFGMPSLCLLGDSLMLWFKIMSVMGVCEIYANMIGIYFYRHTCRTVSSHFARALGFDLSTLYFFVFAFVFRVRKSRSVTIKVPQSAAIWFFVRRTWDKRRVGFMFDRFLPLFECCQNNNSLE